MSRATLTLLLALLSGCGVGLDLGDLSQVEDDDVTVAFAGVQSVKLTASNRLLVRWDAGSASSGTIDYDVYTGASSDALTLATTVSDTTEAFVSLPAATTAYVRVQARVGTVTSSDTTVTSMNVAANSTHPILAGDTYATTAIDDVYAHDVQQSVAAFGSRADASGNIYWADNNSKRIQVICVDPSSPGGCNGRERDKVYWIAGSGVSATPIDGELVKSSPLREVRGLTVDSSGNVFLADYGAHYVTALCFDDSAPGGCFGKTEGRLHILAGTGVNADGAENAVPTTVAVPRPNDVALDTYGNLYFSSYEGSPRVRVICYDVSTANHFCDGRTGGNVYYYAGTNTEGVANDDVAATAGNLGRLFGIELDPHGNLFLAELRNTGRAVRVVCNYDASALGICNGLTTGGGDLFRIIGTGVDGDGASGGVATSTNVGNVRSVTNDEYGNTWMADANYNKIRVHCLDVTSTTGNFCEGKTVGNLYTYSSTSWLVDGGSAVSGTGTLSGAHTSSLHFDTATNNLVFGAGNYILRVIRPDAP